MARTRPGDLATLLLSGLRSAELLTQQIGSVTGGPGERRIRVVSKGGKSRSVPIQDALDHVIDTYLCDTPNPLPLPAARQPGPAVP